MRISDWSSDVCSSDLEAPLVAKRCEKRDHGGLEHGAPMFLSLGDDGPATAIRFCRFFANVDFDGVEERGKRVEISERHGDFLIGLDPADRKSTRLNSSH